MTAFAALALLSAPGQALELRGHGGPVHALDVSPGGERTLSGGFDNAAIVWTLPGGAAESVLRFHNGPVKAAIFITDERFLTGGDDGVVALWSVGRGEPERVFTGHQNAVAGLALAPDKRSFASAGWDGAVRVWPLDGGEPAVIEAHQGPATSVAFAPSGAVVSAGGQDRTLKVWDASGGQARVVVLDAPPNAVRVAPNGEIAVSGADGAVRFFTADLAPAGSVSLGSTTLIAFAQSADGWRLAAGGVRGAAAVIDARTKTITARLTGPGLPVWSLAFTPDGASVLSGGADRVIRRWDAVTGAPSSPVIAAADADPLAPYKGERGAEVFRACAACHTLTPDDGARAGPTLHGVFGRRIATARGYKYSEALKRLDIVWSSETIAELFRQGPSVYTPGTKMPEQIVKPDDLAALIAFLEKATR
ncbi:MAG: c-type cytochrome [Hyphomicrobiales bacterium]|nr:c-type cytochrome [Hyphomicrobiales bacterium]